MKQKVKTILKTIFLISTVLTMAMFWFNQGKPYIESVDCPTGSNIALIKIQGSIATYPTETFYAEEIELMPTGSVSSEKISAYLDEIEKDDNIKGIIVEIDSPGGSPVASEEIMDALKRAIKPTVAVIRGHGASGGYLIASGADIIFASEMSDVGGIGVTMSYLDYSQQNEYEGIIYQQLSSGKFKDAGAPDKELTTEERELYMRDVIKLHNIFVENIAVNRNLDIEIVEELADGSTMLGQDAKENGLIDVIGSIYDAQEWLSDKLDIEPKVCVY